MDRNLLRLIAQLLKGKQDEAIDNLVEAIIAEGLTQDQIEKLRLADSVDDLANQCGLPN